MIVRILTARVAHRNAGAFEDVLRDQLPIMREHAGLVYVKLARQAHPTYDEVLLFEEWRDAAALYGWTGPDIRKARLLPGAEGLAERVRITHYEALDVDPDAVLATAVDPAIPAATADEADDDENENENDSDDAADAS